MNDLYVATTRDHLLTQSIPGSLDYVTLKRLASWRCTNWENLKICKSSIVPFYHVIRFFTSIVKPFRYQPLIPCYFSSSVTIASVCQLIVESVEFSRSIYSVTLFGFPVFTLGPFNQGLSQVRSICSLFVPTHHPFSFPITITRCWGVSSSTPGP